MRDETDPGLITGVLRMPLHRKPHPNGVVGSELGYQVKSIRFATRVIQSPQGAAWRFGFLVILLFFAIHPPQLCKAFSDGQMPT